MGLKILVAGLLICVGLAGCGGGSGADAAAEGGAVEADAGVDEAAPVAAAEGGPVRGGRWQGVVTGGYDGNVISFVVAPGGELSEITFEGHWDCADGIETTIMGPSESYPTNDGAIDITSVDPPDGGASATRFVLSGQIGGSEAAGTLRANINAMGCDTGELDWSAAPAS